MPLLDAYNSKSRFQHIFSFSTLRIFYVNIATSEGGVCISSVGKYLRNNNQYLIKTSAFELRIASRAKLATNLQQCSGKNSNLILKEN